MAERLTERDDIENKRYIFNSEENVICVTNKRLDNCFTIAYCWGKPIDKLAKFEDIMEKYGIDSVEELEELLDDNKYAQNVVFKQLVELQNAKTDRDTWKRACELACDVILRFTDGCPCKADYFYQQAKKEGNDERN